MTETCRLCLSKAELRRSHILPEFLYDGMYDGKGRVFTMPRDDAQRVGIDQKGLRERLLCQQCETKLSVWEGYAVTVFDGRAGVRIEPLSDRFAWMYDVDYEKFKLFLLSCLWRSGVSSLPFFERVKLGPHEEKLRTMLHSADPGGSKDYGALLCGLTLGNEPAHIIVQPTESRLGPLRCYRFTFRGLFIAATVASHPPPMAIRDAFLREDGRVALLRDDAMNVPFLSELMGVVAKRDLPIKKG